MPLVLSSKILKKEVEGQDFTTRCQTQRQVENRRLRMAKEERQNEGKSILSEIIKPQRSACCGALR